MSLIDSKYRLDQKLGEGSFGVVFKLISGDQVRAGKLASSTDSVEKMLCNEYNILRKLNHPNIVKIKEYDLVSIIFNNQDEWRTMFLNRPTPQIYPFKLSCPMLVMELYQTDLLNLVNDWPRGQTTLVRSLFGSLVSAVDYVHKLGYVHRDIKLENVFVDANYQVYLGDWGFACPIKKLTINRIGSLSYAAPEIISDLPNQKSDIWSLGVIFYAMHMKRLPFVSDKPNELCQMILSGQYSSIKSSYEAQSLLSSMLILKPESRISAEQILNHAYFDCTESRQSCQLN
jgi:serine/threonine protein kinase